MAEPVLDASVIVTSYNQLASTSLALEALFAQHTSSSYEVIVCDDGSDAETVDGLQALLAAAPVPAYLVWQQDRGFRAAASRNNGIHLARGRILVFLDGDMVPEEDFVQAHVSAHAQGAIIGAGKRVWRSPGVHEFRNGGMPAVWGFLRDEGPVERLDRATTAFEMFYRHFLWKADPWLTCFSCNISTPNLPCVEFDDEFVSWGYEDYDLFYGLNVVHGLDVVPIDATAYEVGGRVDKSHWPQANFLGHLINGFRFHDKWQHTGLTFEYSIPRYDLDLETGLWRFSSKPIFGGVNNDFPEYVEEMRELLISRGLYPETTPVNGATLVWHDVAALTTSSVNVRDGRLLHQFR